MANTRKTVDARAKDRSGVTAVNLRVPDDLLAAFDARLEQLNTDPTVPQWTRTSLILKVMANATKEWEPSGLVRALETLAGPEAMARAKRAKGGGRG